MNKSRLKARETRFKNHIHEMDIRPTYEIQNEKRKSDKYYDTRKRIE